MKSSPIRYEENNFFITKCFLLFSLTKPFFFTQGWRAWLLVNMWSMTTYTWTPKYVFLSYYFLFLQIQTSFFWTQKLVVPEIQYVILKTSALVFMNSGALNSWSLTTCIFDLVCLYSWKQTNIVRSHWLIFSPGFFLGNEVKARYYKAGARKLPYHAARTCILYGSDAPTVSKKTITKFMMVPNDKTTLNKND